MNESRLNRRANETFFFVVMPNSYGYVPQNLCTQSNNDYSSYSFDARNLNHVQFHETNFVERGNTDGSILSLRYYSWSGIGEGNGL
jgi:hypothetical protein